MEQEEAMMLSRLFNSTLYAVAEYFDVKLRGLDGGENPFPGCLLFLIIKAIKKLLLTIMICLAKWLIGLVFIGVL